MMDRKSAKSGRNLHLDKTKNSLSAADKSRFYGALAEATLRERFNAELKVVEKELQRKVTIEPWGKIMAMVDTHISPRQFKKIEPEINKQLRELINNKMNIESMASAHQERLNPIKNQVIDSVLEWTHNPSKETELVKSQAIEELVTALGSPPFIVELYYLSHKVTDIMGKSCAGDVAKVMTCFKIENYAEGKASRAQAHSLLNITGALKTNPKPNFTEKAAIFYRFYLACRHIINSAPSNATHLRDIIKPNLRGGALTEKISHFIKQKSTKAFLEQLASTCQNYGGSNLTDEELKQVSAHGFEYLAFMLGYICESKAITLEKGKTFQIKNQILEAQVELGAKLTSGEPITRPLKFIPIVPLHRR